MIEIKVTLKESAHQIQMHVDANAVNGYTEQERAIAVNIRKALLAVDLKNDKWACTDTLSIDHNPRFALE